MLLKKDVFYVSACWCLLPPLATSFFSSELDTREIRYQSPPNEQSIHFEESLPKIQELKSLIDWLRIRIDLLEEGNVEQTEHLSNFSRTFEDLQESDTHQWTKYDDKILALEKRLDSEILSNAHARDIESIKLEFEALKVLYSQLKSCCNARMEFFTNDELQKRIERVVSDYFGATPPVSKFDITRILQKLRAAEFTEEESKTLREGTHSEVIEARMHEIVKEAIRTYDADKTGRVDYALESAGGQIISTRCTQRYDGNTRAFKLLSFTLYHENNNPRTVIQGNLIQPGTCWAFQGFPGYLLIKLRSFIYVTGFTLEHAAKSILPNSEMKSAPRKFNVWGFADENDPEPVLFGDYEFLSSGESLQYFPVQNTLITKPYEYVELRVHSNHGQLEYTCLYRFRVHGRTV